MAEHERSGHSPADQHALKHMHEHLLGIDRHLATVAVAMKHIQESQKRVEESQGRVEDSQGRDEGRIMEMQARLERIESTMAVNTQVKDALDALEVKIAGRVTTEMQQVKDAILAAVGTAAATIDELNAKIAVLVAEGDPSETVTSISDLGNRLDTEIDSIAPGPVTPPPVEGTMRRR